MDDYPARIVHVRDSRPKRLVRRKLALLTRQKPSFSSVSIPRSNAAQSWRNLARLRTAKLCQTKTQATSCPLANRKADRCLAIPALEPVPDQAHRPIELSRVSVMIVTRPRFDRLFLRSFARCLCA